METKKNISGFLLVIIAILVLAVAVLAGYVISFGNPLKDVENEGFEKQAEARLPADSELLAKSLYEEKNLFNLKSTEKNKNSVLQANIELIYFKEVKGIKSTDEKLKQYDGAIKEVVATYFQNITIDEARLPETKEKAKKELIQKINEILLLNESVDMEIVYRINFNSWFYQ